MATQAIEQIPAAEEADTAAQDAPKSRRSIIIFAILGLAGGAAAGLFGVGPILAKRRAAAPPKHAEEALTSSISHAVENLVLNPAGTGGSRFLMVTATFQLRDGAVDQEMKDHDAEVRDRILGVLGRKTVDELSDINQREIIKKEILDGVSPLFSKGAIKKVFFAQFVIQ